MSEQQNGVSPASAGGAPAPDLAALCAAVLPALDAARKVFEAAAGPVVDAEILPDDSDLRRLADHLHAIIGEPNCLVGHVTVEHVGEMIGYVERHLDAISDGNRPRPPQPDPRDAEIAQLRAALAGYQKRLGGDLLSGGKLVERVRAALRVDDGGTCTRASMDGVVGDVGRLCDEVERLRGEAYSANVALGRIVHRVSEALNVIPGSKDAAELASVIRDILQERDEILAEWKRADAEVTRLKRLVGDEIVPEGWGFLSRHDAIVRCEEAWQEHLKQRDQIEALTAERDRLCQELDLTDEQRPKFRDGQRVRIGRHFGTVEKPKDVTRVRLDGMAPAALFETRLVNAIEDRPAEPRRWVAGDPEPAVGTTVRSADGRTFTRRSNGSWHGKNCSLDCRSTGPLWSELLIEAPLVEVVSTDGD